MRRAIVLAAAALLASACGELPQDGPKPFVPQAERGAAGVSGAPLSQRAAGTQDENQVINRKR